MKRREIGSFARLVIPLLGFALLAGCSSPPQTMYNWGDYEKQTFVYLKGSDTAYARQIAGMLYPSDEPLGNSLVPPGYHAHLGLLYHLAGDDEQMMQEYGIEKSMFPESAPFMEYLMHQAEQKRSAGRNSTAFPAQKPAGQSGQGVTAPGEKPVRRQPEDSSTVDVPDTDNERLQSITQPSSLRKKSYKPDAVTKPPGREFIMLEVTR